MAPLRRNEATKNLRRILILCEGTKTEPQYFEKFPIDKNLIELEVLGEGCIANTLVDRAIEKKEAAENRREPYIQVWCVFDKDNIADGQFNQACEKADANNVSVAYSNEAFELWYLLHFEYLQSGISRRDYVPKLSAYLKRDYKKNDGTIYERLKNNQARAIAWAKMLLKVYPANNPAKNNPSTTVHKLVEQLNRFI